MKVTNLVTLKLVYDSSDEDDYIGVNVESTSSGK